MSDFETYVVSLSSPLLDGPFEVELLAPSETAAIARTRISAFHYFREAEMLHADCVAKVTA